MLPSRIAHHKVEVRVLEGCVVQFRGWPLSTGALRSGIASRAMRWFAASLVSQTLAEEQ